MQRVKRLTRNERGKEIEKSENSRWISKAFCQVIEGSLTIVIDNDFRKCDKNRVYNCVLARREGCKSELLGRVARYYKHVKINTNRSLSRNYCISYLVFFKLHHISFLIQLPITKYRYQILILALIEKLQLHVLIYYRKFHVIYLLLNVKPIYAKEFVKTFSDARITYIYLLIEIAFYCLVQLARVLKSKVSRLSWEIYWDKSHRIWHLNTRRIMSAFPSFRPVASVRFGLINYSAWRVDRARRNDYPAVHEKRYNPK